MCVCVCVCVCHSQQLWLTAGHNASDSSVSPDAAVLQSKLLKYEQQHFHALLKTVAAIQPALPAAFEVGMTTPDG